MTEGKNARTEKPKTEKGKGTILIVDDQPSIRLVLKEFLSSKGFVARAVSLAEEALEILNNLEVDLVITNIWMPGMNGLEFTRLIRNRYHSEVIILTGYHSYTVEEATKIGAWNLIHKPAKLQDLLESINRVLDK